MIGFLMKTKIKAHKRKEVGKKRDGKKGERRRRVERKERKPPKVFCLKALDISKAPLSNILFPGPIMLFL